MDKCTGTNDRLKTGKLMNEIEHISNKTSQFRCYFFDVQGAVVLVAVT